MTGFVQIVEWTTSQIEEMLRFNEEWRVRFPQMGPSRILVCADRDAQGRFLAVVEFPSYELAMQNSEDPATAEFAARMDALSDTPAAFRNLDVVSLEQR